MDWFARRFIQSSLAWLCVGVTLGLAMAIHPAWSVYRPAHMHAVMLGFVTMMIYGVGYHVLPRFAGHRLRSTRLAAIHCWTANPGLAGMVVGFVLRVSTSVPAGVGTIVLAIGGLLSAFGAFLFAWNMWTTMNAGAHVALRRAESLAAARETGRPVTISR